MDIKYYYMLLLTVIYNVIVIDVYTVYNEFDILFKQLMCNIYNTYLYVKSNKQYNINNK